MVTACKLEVGSSVRLTLELGPKHPDGINIQGRIVRFEENRKDPRGLWPYSAAVQFDAPVPELEEQLKNKAS